ncbi:C-type lectin 37Da-like [Drosophila teissieri]|uniref:C-type lectin 37Da-like n=1 Tax=Drosophila teissieri TaxID=7243 RepID=UPI001CBA3532|nr:C-type lectin 37Da-like [Drosophila teissieri]
MLSSKLVCFALASLVFGHIYLAASEETIAVCPTDFVQVAGKCLLLDNKWKNFYESDRHCQSLNAGLLSIGNQVELNAINEWLPTVAPYSPELWTSGNKLGGTADYYWQSTGQKALYLPWKVGQPIATAGDCLTLLANVTMTAEGTTMSEHLLAVKTCISWAPHICQAPLQIFKTQLCLNTTAFFEAKVPA